MKSSMMLFVALAYALATLVGFAVAQDPHPTKWRACCTTTCSDCNPKWEDECSGENGPDCSWNWWWVLCCTLGHDKVQRRGESERIAYFNEAGKEVTFLGPQEMVKKILENGNM